MYALLKLLSKVIGKEHPSESISSFITDKEIDRSLDTERRIKTIPHRKLTRKKRKIISVRLRILYNSLSTLDFDIIKSLRNCKEKNLFNYSKLEYLLLKTKLLLLLLKRSTRAFTIFRK